MIKPTKGNLLDSSAETLVNTVNTVGVMGKGLALMFKERFPENFQAYAAACREGRVRVGEMFVTPISHIPASKPRWIINFPTKKHWRDPSQLQWIEDGLESLKQEIRQRDIRSIAIPPLGCGLGGLEWSTIRPLIESTFADVSELEVQLFEPVATVPLRRATK